jgi:hypothetical protein
MLIIAVRLKHTIGALAADDSGYSSSDRALMGRIGQAIGYSVMLTAGLAIWCIPTASLMDVKDWDYDHGGALLAFAGSVQLLWMLVALVVLPLERASAKAATQSPAPEKPGIPAEDRLAAVDTGSVPAAARATRVVLPAPAARPDTHA